jgi:MAF protein
MLEQADIEISVVPPDVDDGQLRSGAVSPREWVMALAYFKARRVADQLRKISDRFANWHEAERFGLQGVVLGADTVCVHGNVVLGQPRDAQHARAMLMRLRNAEHSTITGVCLFDLRSGTRTMFCDETRVIVGQVSEAQINQYIQSGQWRGKAGAYNLSERIDAGWPIQTIGDPDTVMGLPMRRLRKILTSPLLPAKPHMCGCG